VLKARLFVAESSQVAVPRNLTQDQASTLAPASVLRPIGRDPRYRAVWVIMLLLLARLYFWVAQRGEQPFDWTHDSGQYYDLLARGFLHGHLYLPINPQPALLALKNPWDPNQNGPYALLDAVLYKGRYYIYHGVAPAVVFFVPWRLLAHHDLPEGFAVMLCCLGAWIVGSELLFALLSNIKPAVPIWLFALLLMALGLGQTAPFLLVRAVVYEVPIAAGYLFVTCGFLCLFKTLTDDSKARIWAVLAGVSFGLAAGSRPHLGLGIIPALLFLICRRSSSACESGAGERMSSGLSGRLFRREVIAFAAPVLVCCAALAAYNYARFGNPLEFGLKYQLAAGPEYQNLRLSAVNLVPGLYYFLISTPLVEPVFPFFRLFLRNPFWFGSHVLPPRYFIEPVAGIGAISPLILLGLLAPFFARTLWKENTQASARGAVEHENGRAAFQTLSAMYVHALGCLLFIAALGLTTHRFEPDFEPPLLIIGFVVAAALLARLHRFGRVVGSLLVTLALIYSVVANAALAIGGPFDNIAQFHPRSFLKVARWFSPIERFRPVLNPELRVRAYFEFPEHCTPGTKSLVSAGELAWRYVLTADCNQRGKLVLISGREPWSSDSRTAEVQNSKPGINLVDVHFSSAERHVIVRFNGDPVIDHSTPFLITAPSQIRIGSSTFWGRKAEFPGRVVAMEDAKTSPRGEAGLR
jgi:hypothetical protein